MQATADLDITDAELNQMARETLAEMGEASPALPDAQPTPEDNSLSWKPRGGWLYAGHAPAELGTDSEGRLLLSLRAMSSQAPQQAAMALYAVEQDNKARAEVLAALQSEPCWQSFLEAKSETDSTRQQIEQMEAQRRKLEQERLKHAAKPKGQGSRIAAIQTEQAGLGRRIEVAQIELNALQPILQAAHQTAEVRARQLALETVGVVRIEAQNDLDVALTDFYSRHAEELTAIAGRLHARRARNHAGWLAALQTFALSCLDRAEPLPEPEAATAAADA